MSEPATRPTAVFDFDGTLTDRDTLVPFLARQAGWRRVTAAVVRTGPAGRDRNLLKARVLEATLGGTDVAEARLAGRRYADELHGRLRPGLVEQLRWHQGEGHRTVLVSASLLLYLEPLGRRLGFDHVVAVALEEEDGRLTGRLAGPNVRGAEKARRLDELIDPGHHTELWVYGDASGDADLLRRASHPMPVTARAHRLAEGR